MSRIAEQEWKNLQFILDNEVPIYIIFFKNKTICRYLGSCDGNTTNSCSHVQSVQPLKEFQKNELFWVYFRIWNFFEIEKTSKKTRKNKKKPEN